MIDFLCIGGQKCGTSWLNANLSQHPNVWTPFIKELHFFDVLHLGYEQEPLREAFRGAVHKRLSTVGGSALKRYFELVLDEDFQFSDAWYEHIFSIAPENSVRGETTPHYSCLPLPGIRHLLSMAPDVRVIYLIREPFDRALSSLRMAASSHRDLSQVEFVKSEAFQSRGDYKQNVDRWDAAVRMDRILYVPFGKIYSNPRSVISEVERFLGLPAFNGYKHLREKVYETSPVDIDSDAEQIVRAQTAVQKDYLISRFGQEFVNDIG